MGVNGREPVAATTLFDNGKCQNHKYDQAQSLVHSLKVLSAVNTVLSLANTLQALVASSVTAISLHSQCLPIILTINIISPSSLHLPGIVWGLHP